MLRNNMTIKSKTERDRAEKPDFGEVYEEYYERVYKYAYTLLLNKEDAEDVVADTFMNAFSAYGSYDPSRASISTWITRIAHNKAVNLVRSASYRTRAEMPEYYDAPDASDSMLSASEDRDTVLYLYSKLSAGEREFLNLRYTMDMKDSEIAELLGIQSKSVNKRYQRLLAKCRDILEN